MKRVSWCKVGVALVVAVSVGVSGCAPVFASSLSTTTHMTPSMRSNAWIYTVKPGPRSVSGDGRTTVFSSSSTELTPNDLNDASDIFAYDRIANKNELITRNAAGQQANGQNLWPGISQDGRYIAFISNARNLAPGAACADDHYCMNLLVYDRRAKTYVMANRTTLGVRIPLNRAGYGYPTLSADGRFVTFLSDHSLTPNDTNDAADVVVRDLRANVTRVVSVDEQGKTGPFESDRAIISYDGRYVSFATRSPLVPADRNNYNDIYVRDIQLGKTMLISGGKGGRPSNAESFDATLSGDGQFVAFISSADNLVEGDTNDTNDVFLRDIKAGVTRRISTSSLGKQANNTSYDPDISADGRYVVFNSWADNLVRADSNDTFDIFMYYRDYGLTRRINVGSRNGVEANDGSFEPSISGDGKAVAIMSNATNLTAPPPDAPWGQLYMIYNPVVHIPFYDANDSFDLLW